MSTDGLFLKWDDFEQNASSTFKRSKKNLEFSDVTLVAEDGQHIEAHRLIISSGCDFFTNLFNISKAGHTVVFMRGIPFDALSAIVDFIYSGETKIPRKDLTDFLLIADELMLKGLAKDKTLGEYENIIKDSTNEAVSLKGEHFINNEAEDTKDHVAGFLKEDAFPEESLIKGENHVKEMDNAQLTDLITQITDGSKDVKAREVAMNLMLSNLAGKWTCPICDNTCKSKQSLRTHIEGLHCSRELSYNCNLCQKICRSKHALACHKSLKHRT